MKVDGVHLTVFWGDVAPADCAGRIVSVVEVPRGRAKYIVMAYTVTAYAAMVLYSHGVSSHGPISSWPAQ